MLSAVFAASLFAGCNTSLGAEKGVLNIRYFASGYGSDWLEYAAEKYKEEHPGFKYKLIADPTITNTVGTYLKSGQNLADIYMTQGSAAWTEWVSLGYIENLQSVYETEVQTSAGPRKIKDYIDKDLVNKNYAQRIYGQGEYYPWLMPWGVLNISFAYNEDILLSTKHTVEVADSNFVLNTNWTRPPETMEELGAYCTDVLARGDKVKPLSLAFADALHWMKFPMYVWWAQYQGIFEENTANIQEGDGAYYDFFNFENAEVWKQEGIQKAIDAWRGLIVDDKGNWKNTVDNIEEHTVQDAERLFASGESALLLAGSFFYNETKDYLDQNGDGKDDYTFKMMNMPRIGDGKNCPKNNDNSYSTVNFFSTDDCMFIPAKATNKDLAKDFLAYLCNEEMLLKFTQTSGSMRPFDYNPIELLPDEEWNPFTASCFEMYYNSDVRLYDYPANKAVEDISPMYLYKKPSLAGSVGDAAIIERMRTRTGKQVMVDDANSVYSSTAKAFKSWKTELGLD